MSRNLYLWDTNTFSDLVKGIAATRSHYKQVAPDQVAISVITEAEIRYGLAKKPEVTRYAKIVEELFQTISILPWTSVLTESYSKLRLEAARAGIVIGSHDLLIATHAYFRGRILVSSDKALNGLRPWITVENWRN